jgi:hypothetical protein
MCRRRSSSSANWLERLRFQPGAAELPLREEVVRVKYFKITKTWSVKAESEDEAIKQVAADPGQFLESEKISRTEYKKPQQKAGGWKNGFKNQLLGQQ